MIRNQLFRWQLRNYTASFLPIPSIPPQAGDRGDHRNQEVKKLGRKPKYENPEEVISSFYQSVSESFNSPGEGEQGRDGHKKQELLAEEFGISRIKVRKILITTGDVSYPATKQIQSLLYSGKTLDQACEELKIGRSTANSLLPYSKGVYNLSEVSAAADRTAIYRSRAATLRSLHTSITAGSDAEQKLNLWKCVCLFAGYPFVTSGRGGRKTKDGENGSKGGVKFSYTVPSSDERHGGGRKYEGQEVDGFGNELFIVPSSGESRGVKREKSISRSSVDYAFDIVSTSPASSIKGPKQLKVYGSSYIYSLFVRFGLINTSAVDVTASGVDD